MEKHENLLRIKKIVKGVLEKFGILVGDIYFTASLSGSQLYVVGIKEDKLRIPGVFEPVAYSPISPTEPSLGGGSASQIFDLGSASRALAPGSVLSSEVAPEFKCSPEPTPRVAYALPKVELMHPPLEGAATAVQSTVAATAFEEQAHQVHPVVPNSQVGPISSFSRPPFNNRGETHEGSTLEVYLISQLEAILKLYLNNELVIKRKEEGFQHSSLLPSKYSANSIKISYREEEKVERNPALL